jgi:hypothetical protein
MGRILFLSAVAFVAYRYIARSNQRHQQLPSGDSNIELLPPTTLADVKTAGTESAVESDRQAPKQLVGASRAVEPDPGS